MPALHLHGAQIWSNLDLGGAAGTLLHIVADAERVVELAEVNGREELKLHLPRTSPAWDHVAKRRVIRLSFDDGTVSEWRIVRYDEAHSSRQLAGVVHAEGVLYDLLGPRLCERINGGIAETRFELLSLTPSDHLTNVVLPAAPAWFSAGTVDPTERVDLLYEHVTPLRALDELAELTKTERRVRRDAGGNTYRIDLLNEIGAGATQPRIRIGTNLRAIARVTDDRETATKIYAVGAPEAEGGGAASIGDARWKVKARDTTADWIDLEVTHKGAAQHPVWKDDALNGFYIGNPDRTEIQQITDSVVASGRVFVADAALYAVGDELKLFRNSGGDSLNYVEDPAVIASDADRKVEVLEASDVPQARNLVLNPRLDQHTAGAPHNATQVGTPTTFVVDTVFGNHQIGGGSLRIVADAADEGVESDAITLVPTADRPYFSASIWLEVVSGKVRFELSHSTLGTIPDEKGEVRAVTSVVGDWVEIQIVPGDKILLPAGTLKLRVLSEGGAAEWYLDGWQLTQTAAPFPFYDGDPGVELWLRAASRIRDEASSQPSVAYELEALDLADAGYEFDKLTLGGKVLVSDAAIGVTDTNPAAIRLLRLGRDWRRRELVELGLGTLRGGLTDADMRLRRRRDPNLQVEETITLQKFEAFLEKDGSLVIDYAGSPNVADIKYATSTSSQPTRATALAGTTISGRANRSNTGVKFDLDKAVYLTVVPRTSAAKQGPTYEWSTQVPRGAEPISLEILIDDTDGSVNVRVECTPATVSIRYATNVGTAPAWPTDANAEAGTVVALTSGSADIALGASTVDPLEKIRVAIAPYLAASGLGHSGSAVDHGKIARGERTFLPRGKITKTIRIPAAELYPENSTNTTWDMGATLSPFSLDATQTFRGAIVPVKGTRLVAVRARMHRQNTSDTAVAQLFKIDDSEGAESVGGALTHSTTGWQTVSASTNQVVGDEAYHLKVDLLSDVATAHAKFHWFELDYEMEDYRDGY